MKEPSTSLARKLALMMGAVAGALVLVGIVAATRLGGAGGGAGLAARAEVDGDLLLIAPRMSDVLQDAGRWFGQRAGVTTTEEAAALDHRLSMVRGRMWFETARLKKAAPEFAGPVGEIERAFQDLALVGERARELAKTRQFDAARVVMVREFGPRFDRLRDYLPNLTEGVRKQRVAVARAAETRTGGGSTGIWLLVGLAALAVVGAGYVGMRQMVAGPLSELGRCARSMMEGDMAVSIPGGARTDEIGALAGVLSKLRHAQLRQKKMEEDAAEMQDRLKQAEAAENARLVEERRWKEQFAQATEEVTRAKELATAAAAELAGLKDDMGRLTDELRAVSEGRDAEVQRLEGELLRAREALAAGGAREAEIRSLKEQIAAVKKDAVAAAEAQAAELARVAEELSRARASAEVREREGADRVRRVEQELEEARARAASAVAAEEAATKRLNDAAAKAASAAADSASSTDEKRRLEQELESAKEEIAAVAAARAAEVGRLEAELEAMRTKCDALAAGHQGQAGELERARKELSDLRAMVVAEAEARAAEARHWNEAMAKAKEDATALEQMYSDEVRRVREERDMAVFEAERRIADLRRLPESLAPHHAVPIPEPAVSEAPDEGKSISSDEPFGRSPVPNGKPVGEVEVLSVSPSEMVATILKSVAAEPPHSVEVALATAPLPSEPVRPELEVLDQSPADMVQDILASVATESNPTPSANPEPTEPTAPNEPAPAAARGDEQTDVSGAADDVDGGEEPVVAASSAAEPTSTAPTSEGASEAPPAEPPAKPKARRKRVPKENPQMSLLAAEAPLDPGDEIRRVVESGRLPGVDLEEVTSRMEQSRDAVEAMLLESLPGQRRLVKNLRQALEEDDHEGARRSAITLSNEAGRWGEHELRRLAKTVELAIKFQQGNLDPMVEDLEQEAERVFAGLEYLAQKADVGRGYDSGATA